MRTGILALTLLGVLLPSFAEARPRHRPPPRVVVHGPRVVVNPWAPSYVPAPRPGWVWVAGGWRGHRFAPGYWAPAAARVGWAWVAGYWAGSVYVDGYWREAQRPGQVWVDGYYDEDGSWIPGYWAPEGSADAVRQREGQLEPGPELPVEPEQPQQPSSTYHEYE